MNTDKLSKCLALLASDQDGEVLAAARAVVRMLADDGKRPEDLTAKGVHSTDTLDAFMEIRIRQEAAIKAQEIAARLVQHERELVQKQAEQIETLRAMAGGSREYTEKQAKKIEALEDKLEELSPPLDWPEIAGRYNRKHRADGIEYRALTGKLTLSDKRILRAFDGKKRKRRVKS